MDENPLWKRQFVQTRTMEAPLTRIRDEYRWQVFVKLYAKGDNAPVWDFMRAMAAEHKEGTHAVLEIDPQSML